MNLAFLRNVTLLYTLGVVGAFLQIAAAQWDVSAHILGIVETFFTPAHTVLYTGIVLVAIANLLGLLLTSGRPVNRPSRLYTGFRIAIFGTAIQVIAGPLDFWWHSTYGFDPFLFTPAHSLLIIGMVIGGIGMSLGMIRLLQAQRAGLQLTINTKILTGVTILALAALWGQLNFFGYWITDVRGMAYTFGYCSLSQFRSLLPCSFAEQYGTLSFLIAEIIFATGGTLVFWTSKRIFPRTGQFTSVALILAAVYSAACLGFTAYTLQFLNPQSTWYYTDPSPGQAAGFVVFIPIYLLALIPMFLLDATIKNSTANTKLLGLSALVGPLASFIDGRYALGLAQAGTLAIGIAVVPMIMGGILGGLLLTRLVPKMTHAVRLSRPFVPLQSPKG